MRNILIIIIIIIISIFALYMIKESSQNEGSRQKPITVSKHTNSFNESIGAVLNSYYALTEAFVDWDSLKVQQVAKELETKFDSLHLEELQKDSSGIYQTAQSFIADAKTNVDSIAVNNNLTAQRHILNSLTQSMYDFLRVVKYDLSKLYLQECPMAFNETEPGVWLSKVDSIRNPYMGLHHPRYGKGMLGCGETRDTLNFLKVKEK